MSKELTKRVLVTGASGMLGKRVYGRLSKIKGIKVFGTGRNEIDVLNYRQANLLNAEDLNTVLGWSKPQVIVHCAALVNLDFCEKNPMIAENLHINVSRRLARSSGLEKFIYISTDSVFDGQRGNYYEWDEVNPLNKYAESKYLGESAIVKEELEYLVLRTNILGFNEPLRKSLFEWAYSSLSVGQQINGFDNVFFNPLYIEDLANIIAQFVMYKHEKGVYHVGSIGEISKHQFLVDISRFFKFDQDLIRQVGMPTRMYNAKRPFNTTLNVSKSIESGIKIPTVTETIKSLLYDFKLSIS
jgi:dTDP-4-dehydrorhamnose reductase